jgi:translation initiation factor IF-3
MKRGPYKKSTSTPQYRINHQIKAGQIRLIGPDDKQLGVLPLPEAMAKARNFNMDLVEIAPKAQPPVAKIIDYKKFQYLESKKLSKQKKSTTKGELKEIRLNPFMAGADYLVRLNKIKKFLKQGSQIRISVFLKGREIEHKNFGYDIISRTVQDLNQLAKIDQQPKLIGRRIQATISPGSRQK